MNFTDWITDDIKNVLLVEPNFPIPNKSRNHSNFLPIGLLKIAAYLKTRNINVELIRFEENKDEDYGQTTLIPTEKDEFKPDLICVTSIFTYWSKYVKNAVFYYKNKFKDIPILVGGVYASLMPDHCKKYTKCDDVIQGPIPEAENLIPDYSLVDVDYQIIHTSRGCIRKCGFCGTYIIEPEWACKKSIKDEIIKKKLIFYDNNLLANQYIEDILNELIELKKEKKISYLESQSGFDGRILRKKPYLAKMLKDAGFKNPKIAWDYGIKQAPKIKEQIDLLIDVGFTAKEISVFMIYNYEPNYEEMEEKRVKCAEWGVQITDCRYRPLDAEDDNYSSYKKNQTSEDYYIHEECGWTDAKVRKFRRNIRRHNICMRHGVDYHSTILERKQIPQEAAKRYREMKFKEIKEKYSKELPDAWCPLDFHPADEQDYFRIKKR
ncbi:cobalamin-dependent protein [Methanobrevibacter sp.]|uniref:cobalamin-dependent protein n=1 Tax=Methanobrevibacter sp. TaxID=66852 RepID=UPI00386F451B